MKKFFYFSIFLLPIISFAFTVSEKPASFISDFAGVLSAEQKIQLETKISNFEKQTTNEIAVVIISSLDGDNVENVAQDIFTKWGIGKKDKNNGVLFLISIGDRKTRIHTGYGVEGDLTDIGTSYIQSEVVTPAFRAEDYYGGINDAVDKMIDALGGNQIVPEGFEKNSQLPKFNWDFIIIVGFILIQWIAAILAKSKSWWGGGVLGGLIGGGIWYFFITSVLLAIPLFIILILLGLFFDFIVSRAYEKHKASGDRLPWFFGGGGFGGGSSGGGFGGFGGGSSGGGGSSSSW